MGNIQAIYVDTPGLHQHNKRALNRVMNKTALSALHDVDLILFVVDPHDFTLEDEWILSNIQQSQIPVILVLNKIDHFNQKEALLPILQALGARHTFTEIIPISARTGINADQLEKIVFKYLPKNPHFYESHQVTDRDEAFQVSEMIREQVFDQVHEEIPYSSTVIIEKLLHENHLVYIQASIYVENVGQKAILIGKGGELLKTIGTKARLELEKQLKEKVFLQLWVKVKKQWTDNERFMVQAGYASDVEA